MNNQQYGILLAAAAMLALANRPALANVCDQPSPLHEHLGEQYWDVEFTSANANMPLASNGASIEADSKKAQSLLDVLGLFSDRHYGSGEGVRTLCKGKQNQRRAVAFESELRPGFYSEKESGEQRLHFLESASSDEVSIAFDDRVIVDIPTAAQWQVVSDNAISTSMVFRRANGLRCIEVLEFDDCDETNFPPEGRHHSILQQIDTTLAKHGKNITLTQTMYINGQRDSWATWVLEK